MSKRINLLLEILGVFITFVVVLVAFILMLKIASHVIRIEMLDDFMRP